MKKLNSINYQEIKCIFESSYRKRNEVIQFGQTIVNPNKNERVDLIDSLEILQDLYNESSKVYDLTSFNMHCLENTNFEWLEDYEINHINTYNWSAPLTNDLDFKVYKVEGHLFISVAVHNGYSDARSGYMIEFLFKFETSFSSDDWTHIFTDLPSWCKSFTIEDYLFSFDIFSEYGVYNVSKLDGTDEEYEIYVGDYDDCEKWAEQRKEEII